LESVLIPDGKDDRDESNQGGSCQTDKDLNSVAAQDLAQAVRGTGASGEDRFMLQMPPDVLG